MDEQSGRQCRELASVRNWECSRWTATIVWMRVCASAPYRTDRVGRTRSAANGEGALLPKLLIFFRYGQADAEKRSRACLAPNLWFIRMTTGVRLGNHARAAWRRKGSHQMPYKICATVRLDRRLPTRSSVADATVTCIEGQQRGDGYAKLVAGGSALRR